eukprot:gene5208-7246_t
MSIDSADQVIPIIVIGGGVSGLLAASCLRNEGINCIILEASSRHGGRVKSLESKDRNGESFSDFPLEGGAEFVHGKDSYFANLAKVSDSKIFNSNIGNGQSDLNNFAQNNEILSLLISSYKNKSNQKPFLYSVIESYDKKLLLNFESKKSKEVYQIKPLAKNDKKTVFRRYEVDPYWNNDLEKVENFIDRMYAYKGEEMMISDYLQSKFNIISDHPYYHFYDVWIGNENGTSINKIGMKSISIAENLWQTSEDNFLLNDNYLSILEKTLFSPLFIHNLNIDQCEDNHDNNSKHNITETNAINDYNCIMYNKCVVSVDYRANDVIIVSCDDGSSYTCKKVIITVPLTILKENIIDFSPLLPDYKVAAIQSLGMGHGMKIILKFKTCFWGENIRGITTTGYASYIWTPGLNKTNATNNILICFIMGEKAEYLSTFTNPDIAVGICLDELNELFEGLAHENFIDYIIQDWSKEPFIKGAYSFPGPYSYKSKTDNARIDLSSSIDQKLFFAGEATSIHHPATVHGAMESSVRVVVEVMDSFFGK